MKAIVKTSALLACAAFLLGGCGKLTGSGSIRFTAASPSAASTKADWGEDVNNVQRIVWANGDPIFIKSNFARTEGGADSFTYTVTNIDDVKENGVAQYSYGKLSPSGTGGLLWEETQDKEDHVFWATYPALPVTEGGVVTATIPDDGLVMVARASGISDAVTLYFYPAFTTIRIKLGNGTGYPASIHSCSITALYGEPALTGRFSGTIGTAGVVSAAPSDYLSRVVSQTLGVELEDEAVMSGYADFYLMPMDRSGLELSVEYSLGAIEHTKSLTINKSFVAGKQYRLEGLLLPEEIKLIDFEVISVGQDIETIDRENTPWE